MKRILTVKNLKQIIEGLDDDTEISFFSRDGDYNYNVLILSDYGKRTFFNSSPNYLNCNQMVKNPKPETTLTFNFQVSEKVKKAKSKGE